MSCCTWRLLAIVAVGSMLLGSAEAAPERPLVVIPGILGSKLCRADNSELVWGGVGSLFNLTKLALLSG